LDALSRVSLEVLEDHSGRDTFVVYGEPGKAYSIQVCHTNLQNNIIRVHVSIDDAVFCVIVRPYDEPYIINGLIRQHLDNSMFRLRFVPTELQDSDEQHIKATHGCCRINVKAYWVVSQVEPIPQQPALSSTSNVGNNIHMPYRVKGYNEGVSNIAALSTETMNTEVNPYSVQVQCEPNPFYEATYRTEKKQNHPQDVEVIDLT
jgi:hypothetical protein